MDLQQTKNNPLVPDGIERQVNPEKIYALLYLLPKLFLSVTVTAVAIIIHFYSLLIFSAILLLLGIYKYYLVRSMTYYLTAQQLIIERGVFNKTVHYLELYRIKDILVSRPWGMKILGLMDVQLFSFDTQEPFLSIKGIKVTDISTTIRQYVQQCRTRNKVLSLDN